MIKERWGITSPKPRRGAGWKSLPLLTPHSLSSCELFQSPNLTVCWWEKELGSVPVHDSIPNGHGMGGKTVTGGLRGCQWSNPRWTWKIPYLRERKNDELHVLFYLSIRGEQKSPAQSDLCSQEEGASGDVCKLEWQRPLCCRCLFFPRLSRWNAGLVNE